PDPQPDGHRHERGRQQRDEGVAQVRGRLRQDAPAAAPAGGVGEPLPRQQHLVHVELPGRSHGVTSRDSSAITASSRRASTTQASTPTTIGPMALRLKPSVNSEPSWLTPTSAAMETIETLLTAATRRPAATTGTAS